MLLVAHRAIPGTSVSRSVSGACVIERCSPWSVPFPPQPPRKLALLCSTGSQVLRHSPTSLVRACPLFGLWPLRTGLVLSNKDVREISRFSCMLFLSVRGFSDYAGPNSHSRNSVAAVLPFSISEGSRHPDPSAFRSSIAPAHWYLWSTLHKTPHGAPCKTRGQDGVAVLLSCRALSSPTTCRFIPAHSEWPTNLPEPLFTR